MEQTKRKIHYGVYVSAILVTLLFFIVGLMVGNYVAYKKVESLDITQKAILTLVDFANLKSEVFLNRSADYCDLGWDAIWEEKIVIGTILTSLEQKFGKTNKNVIEQKKLYQEVQLKTLNIIEKINEKCDKEWNIILFFYTNKKNDRMSDTKLSELQGYILDSLTTENAERVKIFAFDINLDDEETKTLIKKYNITSAPSLVINKKTYNRFMNKYEIQKIIE
ncbi:MAG: hypothetical protein N3D20_02210 [Candidatus Pacearchaeota archaeon]|nr:hypothetical protein [Candidatus Pacearchaeota archaeon]